MTDPAVAAHHPGPAGARTGSPLHQTVTKGFVRLWGLSSKIAAKRDQSK
ncbi:hypothetical protein [Actinosynnema sp. NPDC023587]